MTDSEKAIDSAMHSINMLLKAGDITYADYATWRDALQEKADRDKMRCANCEYGCPADYGICSCSAHKMSDTDYDTYCSYFVPKESEDKTQ